MPRPKNQKERLALKAKLAAQAPAPAPEPAPEPSVDVDSMKKAELADFLTARGVTFDPKAKKAELASMARMLS